LALFSGSCIGHRYCHCIRAPDHWRGARNLVFVFVDAVALGMYAAIGVQKTLDVHIGWLAALIVGVLNAVGGGVIRDVLAQRPALLFQPSQFYGVAALTGCVFFVIIVEIAPTQQNLAGIGCVLVTAAVRLLARRFNWRTRAVIAS
jgi:uncharacterized membrane protein YeiH